MGEITKAVIPLAGLGTRFLPLSKVIPKELFPLGDKPLIQYGVEELKAAGVKEIIFVLTPQKKIIGDYFKKSSQLEKLLEEQKKEDLLEEVRKIENLAQGISFVSVLEPKPLGDGHAVLQAKKAVGDNPCFVLYPDDIIEAPLPVPLQLFQVFKTSQKPVLALFSLPKEKLSAYGIVGCEKIASRLSKIKKIVEKPPLEQAPSNLAIVGRSIITPEVFGYLKKAKPNKRGEISLTETFGEMVRDGKMIYGYEFEGRWWECGNKRDWMRSNLYFTLKHSEFGHDLQIFLKQEKLF